jgi:hypothetical protein
MQVKEVVELLCFKMRNTNNSVNVRLKFILEKIFLKKFSMKS